MFLLALRDVAEAFQMSKVAEQAGVSRESIYRMLKRDGNPTYASLTGILRALGLRIAVEADIVSRPPKRAKAQPREQVSSDEGVSTAEIAATDERAVVSIDESPTWQENVFETTSFEAHGKMPPRSEPQGFTSQQAAI
jgi:transcriptional regulator with XRE-family HTH domain